MVIVNSSHSMRNSGGPIADRLANEVVQRTAAATPRSTRSACRGKPLEEQRLKCRVEEWRWELLRLGPSREQPANKHINTAGRY
jgi:hypothetical protein